MSARHDQVAAAIVGWTVVAVVAVFAAAPSWLRVVVVVPFVVVVIGAGWAAALTRDLSTALAIAIGVSLASATIVAEAMALTGLWSPRIGFGVLAAVAIAGAVLQRSTGRKRTL